MKLLREYIRELLQEKKFSDLRVPKGVWEKIPPQYISSEPDEEGLDHEIFDLISTAYSSLPGGNIKVKSPDDVPGEYTFFDVVDVDDDPQPDAVVFGKVRGNALKIGGMGHDGAKGKRVSITRLIELLKQPGFFAEVSGVPAKIALSAGVPVVEDEQKVRDLIKRDLEWVGEAEGKDGRGWYKRQYGPGVHHLKIVVGSV
jgi:hypothetical protein